MKTIYIVRAHTNASLGHEDEADEVFEIKPDKIICWCAQEAEYEAIFGKFFDKLENWLEKENKFINLITPHLDNVWVRPRVLAENSCGYLFDYMYHYMMKNHVMIPDIVKFNCLYNLNFDYKKLYSCYINNCDFNRALLVDQLAKHKLLDEGIVTFRYPERYPFWKYHDGSRLFDEENFTLHEFGYTPNEIPKSFLDCFFDVVCESRYDHKEFFITEKTLKSIMCFKPFLVLSCSNFHKDYLEKFFGFKLYDEIFDYSFDSKEDINDRIQGIIDNISKLKNLSLDELKQLYKKLIPKIQYNKSRVFEILFDKNKIIPKSGKFYMEEKDFILHSKYPPHEFAFIDNLGWNK